MPPAAPGRAGGTRSLSPAPRDVPGRAPAPRSAASRRESPGKEPGVPGMLLGCGTGVCGCAGGHNSPRVPSLPLGAGCQAAGPSAQTCPVLASPQPGGAGGWQGRGAAPRPSPLAPGRPAEHGERCSSAWLKEGLRGFPVALQSCWETSLGGSPAPAPAWDCFRSLLQGHRAPAVPTPPPPQAVQAASLRLPFVKASCNPTAPEAVSEEKVLAKEATWENKDNCAVKKAK